MGVKPSGLSRAKAIEKLFGIKLSKYPKFKDKLSTLEDNGTLKIEREDSTGARGSRAKRLYLPEHLNPLYNVVIISGVYPKPDMIRRIMLEPKERAAAASDLKDLLSGRDSVGGIEFVEGRLNQFIADLASNSPMTDRRITNPFVKLPQTIKSIQSGNKPVNVYYSVMEAYHSPDTVKTELEAMMAFYCDNELESAYKLAIGLGDVEGLAAQYKDLVCKAYSDAKDFDDLLDFFAN